MTAPTTVQTTGNGASVSTLTSATYTVPAGNNKRLLVALHGWLSTSSTNSQTATITHNGVSMTQQARSASSNANGGSIASSILWVFDLALGSTTPSGAIVATLSAGMRTLMVAMTVADVDQAATPALTLAQSIGPDSVTSATTDTVVDFVSNDSQNTTTGYALTLGAGQTSLSNARVLAATGNEGGLASSYANTPATPTTSMSWTGNQSLGPRSQHVVAAYAAAAAGGVAADVAATEALDTSASAATFTQTAATATTEANDTASGVAAFALTAAVTASEADDTASGSATFGTVGLTAAVTATEAGDTADGSATFGLTASVAATEAGDTAAGTATLGDAPIVANGGVPRWRTLGWGGQRPDRESLADQLARIDVVPAVVADPGHIPAPAKVAAPRRAPVLFDTKAALAAAERVTASLKAAEMARRQAEDDDEDVTVLLLS